MISNPFDHETAAKRYHKVRPYFHPLVMDKIRSKLGLQTKLSYALDVACGTGRSSVALKELSEYVTGCDNSKAMLSEAVIDPLISYVVSPAEQLPFENGRFQLATVCNGFHWLDRSRFLPEVWRTLTEDGWLVIYNWGPSNEMVGNPDYKIWHEEVFLKRFPPPPSRNLEPLTANDAEALAFDFVAEETFEYELISTVEDSVMGFTTQSDVILKIEEGAVSFDEVYAWLIEQLTPLFHQPEAAFKSGGPIWYLKKRN